ncbi:MAG: sulfur carrier protein ThiS [Synergistetes bacterium]|nr:sulfur carrier protein ThiS [Synergistota bacterium]MDW8191665.1 sulfur carrier protein ThiS [Synergistota bacterium]
MFVKVNNKTIEISKDISIGQFLESLGYDVSSNTVMVNGDVLPRDEYYRRLVKEGDEIVVIYLMAGG